MAVPGLYIPSDPSSMDLQFWCHCKTGGKWGLDSGDFQVKGTAAVIQCDSSTNREAVVFYANFSRNGEITTSTHPGSGWIPKRAVIPAHYRCLVRNQAQSSPSTLEESGCWVEMCSLQHPHILSPWLHCRVDDGKLTWELIVGSQQSSFLTWVAKCFKMICLKRSSSGFGFDCS